jgi:hypothetical protein
MGSAHRRWQLTDAFGQRWCIQTGARPSGIPSGPGAIEGLLSAAFSSWGPSSAPCRSALLSIYEAIEGPFALDDLRRDVSRHEGAEGERHARELLRSALTWAQSSGRLHITRETPPPVSEPHEQPIPPRPTPKEEPRVDPLLSWFEVRVVDEVGVSVEGIDIAFGSGPSKKIVRTDASGLARLKDHHSSFLTGTLVDPAAARKCLEDRWGRPRRRAIPKGPHVVVADVEDESVSMALEAETRTTLVLVPHFRCNELDGGHFGFSSSFVLASALEPLARTAAELTRKKDRRAMIFGHTDRVGSESLNKQLSERRAKAIFALLTQEVTLWEDLWTGTSDGRDYHERWGLREGQHILNNLGVPDAADQPLKEDGIDGRRTQEAIRRFQTGDYEHPRLGRPPIPPSGKLDKATRRELFLSYAARISAAPIPKARFARAGNGDYMGCGEFNPTSIHAQDEASRRAVIFVFDPAAEPRSLPCELGRIGACKAQGHVETPVDPSEPRPYRCAVYREVAATCPCVAGEALAPFEVILHDRRFVPCARTPYVLVLPDGERMTGVTDDFGMVRGAVRKLPARIQVIYTATNEVEPSTVEGWVHPLEEESDDRRFIDKIRNLGFASSSETDAAAIRRFQRTHWKLRPTGTLDAATREALLALDGDDLSAVLGDEDVGTSAKKKPPPPTVARAMLALTQRVPVRFTVRNRWGSPLPGLKLEIWQGRKLTGPKGPDLETDTAGRVDVDDVLANSAAPLLVTFDSTYVPTDPSAPSRERYIYTLAESSPRVTQFFTDDDPRDLIDKSRAYANLFVEVGPYVPIHAFPWQNPSLREPLPAALLPRTNDKAKLEKRSAHLARHIYALRELSLRTSINILFGLDTSQMDHDALVAKMVELFLASTPPLRISPAPSSAKRNTHPPLAPEPPVSPPPPPPALSEPSGSPPRVQSDQRALELSNAVEVAPPSTPPPNPPGDAPTSDEVPSFPRWVWYLLFHQSGLTYNNAHDSYFDPSDILRGLREREIEQVVKQRKASQADVTEALMLLETGEPDLNGHLPVPLMSERDAEGARLALLTEGRQSDGLALVYRAIAKRERERLKTYRTKDLRFDGDYASLGTLHALRLRHDSALDDATWAQVVRCTQMKNDASEDECRSASTVPTALLKFYPQKRDTTVWRSRRKSTLDVILGRAVCDQQSETGEVVRSGTVGNGIDGSARQALSLSFMTSTAAREVRRGMHLFFLGYLDYTPDRAYPFIPSSKTTPADHVCENAKTAPQHISTVKEVSSISELYDASGKPIPFSGLLKVGTGADMRILRYTVDDQSQPHLQVCVWRHQEIVLDVRKGGELVTFSTAAAWNTTDVTGVKVIPIHETNHILFGYMADTPKERIDLLDAFQLNPNLLHPHKGK